MSTWEYIADEIEARGWTVEEMAERMGGDSHLNFCALEFLQLEDPGIELGEVMAGKIAHAFGTSAEAWLRLDEACRLSIKKHGPQGELR